ncbi:MAG: GNAT family N-acetyltransferase [Bacteroidetes bacterium]|nr:GNAT family N-acetyltransferase [Bacteroidota bacterium]
MEVQILPNTITLENEKVLLRPLEISDIDHLLEFSLHEPEIWKYSLAQGSGKENMIKYISDAVLARASNKEYSFIVFDKIKNRYAGSTRFYDIQLAYKTIQLGYTWYGKEFQGTGLNKNCKYLLLEYAFEILQLERVEFRADNRNERSKAAMLSIAKVDGVLRSNLPDNAGGRRDSIILSILKDEWYTETKENLKQKL